ATNLNEIIDGIGSLYSLSALPVIIAVVFLVISAHEFAHGFTCKHFGGEVREMGFLLIYLQPAFYCNVSDAWLFPEKSKRLWVSFAGPYFELFLWAVATVLWRLTETDTSINYVSLIVMASSGIKTLFNFNPLIKLDGYYLLSDYLGVPNLRKKAFRYIGEGMKKWSGVGEPVAQEVVSPRERKACLAYGLVAAICSFSVLGFGIAKIGSFFIEQSQPVAFMLFSGLLGTKLRRRFRKFFGRGSGPSDLSEDEDEDFDTAPPPESPEAGTLESAQSRVPEPAECRSPKLAESSRPELATINTPEIAISRVAVPVESRTSASTDAGTQEPVESKSSKRAESRKKERSESRKKKRRTWKGPVELVILTGLIVTIMFVGRTDLRIVGAFTVLPREN